MSRSLSLHLSPFSRDTSVKVWHVPTATEHKNLGGHTGGVTCLSAPPLEYCKKLGERARPPMWAMHCWVMLVSSSLVIIGAVYQIHPSERRSQWTRLRIRLSETLSLHHLNSNSLSRCPPTLPPPPVFRTWNAKLRRAEHGRRCSGERQRALCSSVRFL